MPSKLTQKTAPSNWITKPQNELNKPKNKPKNEQGKTNKLRDQENRKEKLVKTTEIMVLKKSRTYKGETMQQVKPVLASEGEETMN
eukprot:13921364-Ditylum_brightwellii.AAC.1